MSAPTHTLTTARLSRKWLLAALTPVVLLLTACSDDLSLSEPATPEAAVASTPMVIERTTTDLVDDSRPPPGSVVLLSTPAPTATLPPTARDEDAVVQRDELVDMHLGERVQIAGSGWAIRFDQVLEDSRCPAALQCIWAGQVVVRLLGEHADGRVAALTLTLSAGDATGLLGDLPIEAVGIEPLRLAGAPLPSEYTLHLRASPPDGEAPLALSGVRGPVTIGPMCPVARLDQPCPDRPYRTTLAVRDAAGRLVSRVTSDEAGMFALPLPEGAYVLEADGAAARLPSMSAQSFRVEVGRWTILAVVFDSGIR